MAKFDYNSSTFRNSAIDRMNGKFGKGDGLKSTSASSASSDRLGNPFARTNPLSQGLKPSSTAKPAAPKAPVARPTAPTPAPASTSASTKPAAAPAAPAAPAKSKRQINKETAAKVAEIKGQQKIAETEAKSSMTPEQKMERREKRASNFGKALTYGFEAAGTALGLYGLYKSNK